MDSKQALKIAELELNKSNIVIVTSNKAVFNLDTEAEIAAVEEYAKGNKYEMFIVKNEASKVEVSDKKSKKDK